MTPDDRPILVGIDDTDTIDTPGTNQLARRIAASLPAGFTCTLILRHQLLFDPRVPFTSKNGSASLRIAREPGRTADELLPVLREVMRDWYVPGSDPGLCVAEEVPAAVTAFARRCQHLVAGQREARALAAEHGIHLEGLGGTEDGVVGALAAVGLAAADDDGRVVHMPGWEWPDDFSGPQPVAAVLARGVDEIRPCTGGPPIREGIVDLGRHLRPSRREGKVVLFVEPALVVDGGLAGWRARREP